MPDLTPDRQIASREAIARRPSRKSRGLKGVGLAGFGALGLTLVLAGFTIHAGASDKNNTTWLAIVTVVVGLIAVGLLITSRRLLRRRAALDGDRAQQDPIQPETTAEEAERYEERFHDFPPPGSPARDKLERENAHRDNPKES